MKKTLLLTAFLGVMTFAAAQDTTGTSTMGDSTMGDSTMADSTMGDSTMADSTMGDSMSGDSTMADSTMGDSTMADSTMGDSTMADSTMGDSTMGDSTMADSTMSDSMSGTSMTMTGDSMMGTSMMMSPADAYTQAQALASQADVAYPVPFYDRTLWKQAVDSAYMAKTGDAQNRDYAAYLAQLYTKTQWWINAYNAWKNLGDLSDQEKQWASLSAAKLAYISLQNGNKDLARQYVNDGMAWMDTPSLDAIMKRL